MNTLLKCFNKKMLVAATASVVLGMGMAGNASAAPYSYAVSFNDVFNWSITDFNTGANIPVLGPAYTSTAHADLNGAIIIGGGIGTNAPIQNLGTAAGADNNFNKIDRNGFYGTGDAMIWNPTHATNIGETYVEGLGTGSGGGVNGLNGGIVLNAPTTILFKFDASPYLEAQTTGTHLGTDWAQAAINFTIALTDIQGNPVFNWSPDGSGNGLLGANVLTDGTDLNHSLFADPLNPGPLLWGCGGAAEPQLGAGAMMGAPTVCGFSATTGTQGVPIALAAGNYTLSVQMGERVNASIPEPGTMLLLGGGLAGLAFTARRRAAVKA